MATATTTITTCAPKPALQARPLLSPPEATRLAATFKVLANDTRLRLLHALARAGELCVTDLAAQAGMRAPAVSNQLARLQDQRILAARESLATALFLATVAVGGIFPVRTAIGVLRRRRLTIGTLLVIATAGALALGVIEEAALLVVVFSLGEVLQDYVSDRARGAIRALMALAPPTAHRQAPDGCLEEVPVQQLQPGELVLVRPGQRLPTDGLVVAGGSAVDQSPVTGESLPVEVMPGTEAFGGTINGTGALTLKVTKPYQDTVLARIIRQVEQAQTHKGRAQRFADRFGATYTPLMVALAVLVATIPPLLGGDWRGWLYRGLVVLVVSCSCALVISVPVAVVAAVSRAARDGILIKGGAHLETLGRVRVVALDKTGTLTRGHPQLTQAIGLDCQDAGQVLALAAAVEATSEHPLAGAILDAASSRGLAWTPGQKLRAIPGVGVEATVAGRRLFVGRPNGRLALTGQAAQRLAALERAGNTTMVLAAGHRPLGLLAVADQRRPIRHPRLARRTAPRAQDQRHRGAAWHFRTGGNGRRRRQRRSRPGHRRRRRGHGRGRRRRRHRDRRPGADGRRPGQAPPSDPPRPPRTDQHPPKRRPLVGHGRRAGRRRPGRASIADRRAAAQRGHRPAHHRQRAAAAAAAPRLTPAARCPQPLSASAAQPPQHQSTTSVAHRLQQASHHLTSRNPGNHRARDPNSPRELAASPR